MIALQALLYYRHSNPSFAAIARYAISEILAEHRSTKSSVLEPEKSATQLE